MIGHGGNAGGQCVGSVLRAMAAGDVELKDWFYVMMKELTVAAGTGLLTSLVVFPILNMLKISIHVSSTIAVTIPVISVRLKKCTIK